MAKKKILVIEDHAMILDFIRDQLFLHDYEVTTSVNGREGIEQVKKGKFDLVVTDWHMPEKNGEDVLKFVRDTDPSTPVMIISATMDAATKDRIRKLSPAAIMEKPFDAHEFLKVVERLAM